MTKHLLQPSFHLCVRILNNIERTKATRRVLSNKPAVDVAAINVHLQEFAAGDFLEVVANLMER